MGLGGLVGSHGSNGGAPSGSTSGDRTPGVLGNTPGEQKPNKPEQPNKPGTSTPKSKDGKTTVTTDKAGSGKSSDNGNAGTSSMDRGQIEAQKQANRPQMSTLASTGANVIGVFAVGLALILGAIPLLRHRREEGEA